MDMILLVFPILAQIVFGEDTCPNSLLRCPEDQTCCVVDGNPSCCNPSRATAIGVTLGVIVAICLVSTFVGICLYLKKRVHKDTVYNVDDIESMYIKSLKKQVSFGGETDLCANCTPAPGTPGFDLPGTPIAEEQFDELGNPIPTPGPDQDADVVGSTDEKNTETASTQVTSAKRTVVTVNLNMKEKENIKLNIFMNKDKKDEEVPEQESFPRGLTAKEAKKKAAKKGSVKGKAPAKKAPAKKKKSK